MRHLVGLRFSDRLLVRHVTASGVYLARNHSAGLQTQALIVHAALTHARSSSSISPKSFLRFFQVAYALPECWVVTIYSGSICLFCFKGGTLPLFICNFFSPVGFEISTSLFASVGWLSADRVLSTTGYEIYISTFVSASNFLHFPFFF
jgi:hypothetical protein